MDTAAPVEAFSVTVGLVAVWLMVGASFRGATAVLSVMVFDHVLVWPKATAALMSLLAPKVWALSATRMCRGGTRAMRCGRRLWMP